MAIAADVPARPQGVELIGEMEGSGYRTPPSLVRRHDGQTLQVTPVLYAVLEGIDGRRGYPQIAEHVAVRTGRTVTASDVEKLVEKHLRPMGLVLLRDGTAPELKRSNPLMGLRFKLAVTDPALTRRLTGPFAALFHWWIWVPVLVVFALLAWWLLMDRGLAAATYQAFAKPSLLLLVLAITVLSAGFHEFGHAAAARRGGAQPGVMGAGLYLLWPAFYTDVTDSYRLGRAGRIRTDLGGLYFNAIVAVAIAAAWWLSGWDALLLIVATQILLMIRQLTPLVRFDGYHVLADVTGVPDLFSRIGPILLSFLPGRRDDPRVTQLKPWVRIVVTVWVLVVVPVLLISLAALVFAAPRLVGSAWEGLQREQARLAQHWGAGAYLDSIGAALAMLVVALPILAMAILLGRLGLATARGLWRRTEGRPIRRTGAAVLVASVIAMVAFAWWPTPERYRPVRPWEGGTLAALVTAPLQSTDRSTDSSGSTGGEITTVLPRSVPLPTEAEPQLALVLVPDTGGLPTVQPGAEAVDPGWVFPFNRPLPPEPGDNQAVAVNTGDGTVTYDIALAMVWVTGEDPVLNTNEAYAFASCSDCITVALAFQVVVIVGHADVVIPQNLSAAVNYQCFECITAAIASQLVVTVDALPGVDKQIALADVWADLQAFASSIPTMPLADVIASLEDYKERVVTILGAAPVPQPSNVPVASGSPTASAMPSASAAPSGDVVGSPDVEPSAVPSSTPSPDVGSPSPSSTPTSEPSASPASTEVPSATSAAAAGG